MIEDMNWNPKISGYTTTYNCISQKYPYEQSINSMLGFCEEVIVMDGGSTDGTFEKLLDMAEENNKIKEMQEKKRAEKKNGKKKITTKKKDISIKEEPVKESPTLIK